MEKREVSSVYRTGIAVVILATIGVVFFVMGMAVSMNAEAGDAAVKAPRVIYPKKTELDFEGARIEGEIRNPGEFYFQRRPEEKFDSLVKRRANFHREMLRDVVLSR